MEIEILNINNIDRVASLLKKNYSYYHKIYLSDKEVKEILIGYKEVGFLVYALYKSEMLGVLVIDPRNNEIISIYAKDKLCIDKLYNFALLKLSLNKKMYIELVKKNKYIIDLYKKQGYIDKYNKYLYFIKDINLAVNL